MPPSVQMVRQIKCAAQDLQKEIGLSTKEFIYETMQILKNLTQEAQNINIFSSLLKHIALIINIENTT